MKKYFLILFTLVYLQSFSQEKNYKITYRHNLQYDTLKTLSDTIGKEAILIGNNNESNYSFAKMPVQKMPDSKDEKTFEQLINSKTSGTGTIKMTGAIFDSIGNMLHQNKKLKTLWVREKMMNEYILTEENTSAINWEITDETRIIQNYTCKKATAHFRGRDYTAWFTTDIPIVAAPWKFFGLPGLLMDIEDSRFQVKIYVEKIEYPVSEKIPGFVNNGTKINLDKYFTFRNEEYKKRLKGMEALLMQQGNMQESISQGGKKPTVKSSSTLYNIETRID